MPPTEEKIFPLSLAEFDARANQLAHETAGHPVTPEEQEAVDRAIWGTTAPNPAAIQFTATLAGANTSARWLSVGHDGDCKVTLEASADQLAAVLRLSLLSGQAFTVQVEPVGE